MRDPINEELHRSRHDHARRFNFDLPAVCKDLEELSRDYAGLNAEQSEERVQQSLKGEPLETKGLHKQTASPERKITGGCH